MRPLLALYKRIMPQHADMRPAMTDNLAALNLTRTITSHVGQPPAALRRAHRPDAARMDC